jgi:hypothetical protein
VNFAFLVVVVAAGSGLVSQVALRPIAPHAGPILALAIMAVALLVASTRERERQRASSPKSSSSSVPSTGS